MRTVVLHRPEGYVDYFLNGQQFVCAAAIRDYFSINNHTIRAEASERHIKNGKPFSFRANELPMPAAYRSIDLWYDEDENGTFHGIVHWGLVEWLTENFPGRWVKEGDIFTVWVRIVPVENAQD